MKIIFMGTSDFAVPILSAIINSHHKVQAVFSQKPKPKGRGMKEAYSPVHLIASQHGIDVYTPSKLKNNEEAYKIIQDIDADVIVVVSYGFIIPKNILTAKKYGCLNVHPSLLPRWRGAAPMQRTIIAGDKETAVCIMQMDEGLDTGDIILQDKFDIDDKITFIELKNKSADIASDLIIQTLNNIDSLPRDPQNNTNITYANKLTKEEGKIDWNDTSYNIYCKIRGMNPWPGTYFIHKNEIIKIHKAEFVNLEHNHFPGTILDNGNLIACKQNAIKLIELQRPGKKRLNIQDFLRGYKF